MQNSEIHNGLENNEVRDFLGKELHLCRMNGGCNSEEYIKMLELQIIEAKIRIDVCKRLTALSQLINFKGWSEFDISDRIYYNKSTYIPFIGTQEEYDNLIVKINKEENLND